MNTFLIEAEDERITTSIKTEDSGVWLTVNDAVSIFVLLRDDELLIQTFPVGRAAEDPLSECITLLTNEDVHTHPF